MPRRFEPASGGELIVLYCTLAAAATLLAASCSAALQHQHRVAPLPDPDPCPTMVSHIRGEELAGWLAGAFPLSPCAAAACTVAGTAASQPCRCAPFSRLRSLPASLLLLIMYSTAAKVGGLLPSTACGPHSWPDEPGCRGRA